MIKTLRIKNLQSHKKTRLDFHAGVNVIIGTSDSGKTSIIRALRWLVENRPGGDAFRAWWGGNTVVTLTTEEASVKRIKTDNSNEYRLNDSVFKAFGTNVPEEIQNTLLINHINLQQQMDSPFLLADSAGDVALHFNKIGNLEQIDVGLRNIQKAINEINQDIAGRKTQLAENEEQLTAFDYLEKMEVDVDVLQTLQERSTQTAIKINKLKSLCTKITDNAKTITKEEEFIEHAPQVDVLVGLLTKKETSEKQLSLFKGKINNLKDLHSKINDNNNVLALKPQYDAVCALKQQYDTDSTSSKNLQKIIRNLTSKQQQQNTYNKDLKAKETIFKKEMQGTCPLCNK